MTRETISFTNKTDSVHDVLAAHINTLQNYLAKLWNTFAFVGATELTISSGAVTVTGNYHTIDTEGDAASDDLESISLGTDIEEASLLIFRPDNDARTIVVKHDVGNILCVGGEDFTLDDEEDFCVAIYDAGLAKWLVMFGSGGGGREILTANRTYYVRTDGSDSNDGLTDSAGGAFLTVQKAINSAAELDTATYNITIQVKDGTFAGEIECKNILGSGTVTIQGNSGTPSNVVIDGRVYKDTPGTIYTIKDFLMIKNTTSNTSAIEARSFSAIYFGNIVFSTGWTRHLYAAFGGSIRILTSYAISASATYHIQLLNGNLSVETGITVTISGTPAFTTFIECGRISLANFINTYVTFSGGATGKRYNADMNSVIFTAGGGASYFPGDVAGTTATGGQYS